MKKRSSRIMSVFLTVCMLMSMIIWTVMPVTVSASTLVDERFPTITATTQHALATDPNYSGWSRSGTNFNPTGGFTVILASGTVAGATSTNILKFGVQTTGANGPSVGKKSFDGTSAKTVTVETRVYTANITTTTFDVSVNSGTTACAQVKTTSTDSPKTFKYNAAGTQTALSSTIANSNWYTIKFSISKTGNNATDPYTSCTC